jgi:hypothetical protein
MGVTGAIALATVLVASCRELPTRPTRYLVLWGRGIKKTRGFLGWRQVIVKGSPLAEVLRKYGVDIEEHQYTTTVNGRKYIRFKLIVRDEKLTGELARLARNEARLRRLMKRFENIVLDVLSHMGRIRGWRKLVKLFPYQRLARWFGIRPFNYRVYDRWRNHAITRFLKPNWRAWLYRKLLAVHESFRADSW